MHGHDLGRVSMWRALRRPPDGALSMDCVRACLTDGMDIGRDLPLIIGLVVAIVIAVAIAAAETAIIRVPLLRARTLAETDKRGVRLVALVERLPAVLNTVLLTALLSQLTAATLTGILAERWFGSLGVTIATFVLTLLLFIYSEAIPKTYAVRHADSVALLVARPISWLERFLRPIVSLLIWIADLQMPGKGITTSPTVTEGELRSLADQAATEGEITTHDRELIERAFRFGDRQADDIMVPRPDIVAVEVDDPVDAVLDIALEHGHRRLPVIDDSIDNIVGMVRLRDLIRHRGGDVGVRDLVSDVLVVPESKSVLELLTTMQEGRSHLAIVVDEYGGTAGLITIEDIAEELLGSVSEDADDAAIREMPGGWAIDGSLPVEDLEDLVGELPVGDWNTAAGLIMGVTGTIPEMGDEVDLPGAVLEVAAVRRRRIVRIDIRRK
jgi:CBS domain containing-hemolysin-like protein